MTPVVSIVGLSGSGKTTLIAGLIAEIKRRGYRVASIKHAEEINFEMNKDGERHLAAGSEATVIATPSHLVMVKPVPDGAGLDEIARVLGDEYDIILTEGFKHDDAPKIVLRRASCELPQEGLSRVAAVVTDRPLKTEIRQFSHGDVACLADLIEQEFIKPQRQQLALQVNSRWVPLSAFSRRIIADTLLGMVSSLKGIKDIKNLQIWLSAGK